MTDKGRSNAATWLFCALAALVEGYDLQSAGLAAPRMAPAFGLAPGELAWVFSSNTIGLLFGALIGGRLSDRIGRKALLIASLLTFGAFSIGTTLASGLYGLIGMRFLTGIGLGGAFPALIALVAETGRPDSQAGRVTMITAGMPLGGALAGLLVLSTSRDWTFLFHVGGVAPILLAVAGAWLLPTAPRPTGGAHDDARDDIAGLAETLFGERRATATLALWTASFATLLILHLLLNWLPTLMLGRGLGRSQALGAALAFSVSGAGGALLLGHLARSGTRPWLLGATYGAMAVGLFALAAITGAAPMIAAAAFVGFFVVGAQFLLYGLSATLYPAALRGSGVGAAVAFGRLGAIAGPLLAGFVLSLQAGASAVLLALLPLAAIAFLATAMLPGASGRYRIIAPRTGVSGG